VRNMAHLVAQDFSQLEGLNFMETFAHVACLEAIRVLLAFAAYKRFKLYQIDVKSIFLNGVIYEEVFVRQPQGFENPEYPDRVHKLSKALYGFKQAMWVWYAKFKTFLLEHWYVTGSIDKTLFTLKHDNDFLLIQIYVDDIIFAGSSYVRVSCFQKMMEKEFQMSIMRELTFFLFIQVKQMKQDIFIHQAKYTKDLMKKFNMVELKPVLTIMSTTTALDTDENGEAVDHGDIVGHSVHHVLVCALSGCPRSSHRTTVQRILMYLKYTLEFRIWYSASSSLDLVDFSDADFVCCRIDRKSTSGICQFFGSSLICWSVHKEPSVAQSIIHAEYVAVVSCCSQIIWIVHTMKDYVVTYKSVSLMCDSSSAICLVQNPVLYERDKHIKVRYHFLRDHIEK
jgi:hypothetical protein